MTPKNKILVAPLNWGIGHATRCIPIIQALLKEEYQPIIASDGDALILLQQEFPKLKTYQLPAYNIQYAKKGNYLKIKLAIQTPKILAAIKKEQKQLQEIVKKEHLKGIISDNRFGIYSTQVPSIYITHQVQVTSGVTTRITTKLHQKIMKNFDEIWIPDYAKKPRLAGKLSENNKLKLKARYIGILSRFKNEKKEEIKKYSVLVLLSGAEPQRSILEKIIIKEFTNYSEKVLFVRGIVSEKQTIANTKNTTYINFLTQKELEKAIKQSDFVVSRSGYSTVMDLAVLQKKVFFIPTPGQTEQEYIARHLQKLKIAPYASQAKFKLDDLQKINAYTGFKMEVIRENKFPFAIFNKKNIENKSII